MTLLHGLRPYQKRMITKTLQELTNGDSPKVVTQAPTGAGKTVMFAAIAKQWLGPVVVMTHRNELKRQTQKRVPHAHVVMINQATATIKSLTYDRPQHAHKGLLIVDEAHHALAPTWSKPITVAAEHGWAISGWTATPARLDGKPLSQVFDKLVHGPSPRWLIKHGYLAPCRVTNNTPTGLLVDLIRENRKREFTFSEIKQTLTSHVPPSLVVESLQKYAAGKKALVFAAAIDIAKEYCDALNDTNVPAALLLSSQTDAQRKTVDDSFKAGKTQALVTVDIVSEGYDCPDVEAAVFARPTCSMALYLQQAGRVLRPAPGKPAGLIIDLVGNVSRHLPPDIDRAWSIDNEVKCRPKTRTPSYYSLKELDMVREIMVAGAAPISITQPKTQPEKINYEHVDSRILAAAHQRLKAIKQSPQLLRIVDTVINRGYLNAHHIAAAMLPPTQAKQFMARHVTRKKWKKGAVFYTMRDAKVLRTRFAEVFGFRPMPPSAKTVNRPESTPLPPQEKEQLCNYQTTTD